MLPIALRPNGRRALVVGGGGVAARKVDALIAAGFPVCVVATRVADARLHSLPPPHAVSERSYDPSDVAGVALVIAATGDDEVNARVVADARAAGALACDASDPQRGDFSMPATVRRGDLTMSVDSGGAAPAFSNRIAQELEGTFGFEYAAAVTTLARMRARVKARLSQRSRAEPLRALAALPVAELAAMDATQADRAADTAIAACDEDHASRSATATVVCATRASALAMTQTRTVAARLAARGIASTILPITTAGDRERRRAIDRIGSVNVFVAELETALREGRADYAVHSCKDLPGELADDLRLAAISKREDPRDAFCSERFASFDRLPAGAVVGTSSPRRRAFLAAIRDDLTYVDARGNVDTRLRKLQEGAFDAIVLAMAGLNRLHRSAGHTVAFGVDALVPAVGQGALAVQTRRDDDFLAGELRAAVDDATTALCVECERAALRALRAGCSAPIGIFAQRRGELLVARGAYAGPSGAPIRRIQLERSVSTVEQARALGIEVAAALAPRNVGRVALARTQARPSRIAAALRTAGIEVLEVSAGDAGPDAAEGNVDMLVFPSSGSVAAAEGYLTRLRAALARPTVVAMGPATARAARAAGFSPDAVAPQASVDALVALVRERLDR